MARNQIAIRLGMKKNKNTKSPAYGKYYAEVLNNETLSTRGLLEHIMSHGLGYPRAIVQGVLAQIAECLTELMLQGQPVKLDGFGTFKLYAIAGAPAGHKNGATDNDLKGDFRVSDWVSGLRLVVIPDNTELDKLTSTANLDRASLTLDGIITKEDAINEGTGRVITPLNVWKEQQAHPNP